MFLGTERSTSTTPISGPQRSRRRGRRPGRPRFVFSLCVVGFLGLVTPGGRGFPRICLLGDPLAASPNGLVSRGTGPELWGLCRNVEKQCGPHVVPALREYATC